MADGSVVIDIKGDDSNFTSTVRGLGSAASAGLGTATGAANGLEKALGTAKLAAANLMANLATQAVTAAVQGIANAASAVVSTGAAFESAMSKVQALSGASADDMERLTAKAKEMGSTTKYTATEAADAMGYMALAGWDANQSIDAIDGVLSLAAASGMDLAHATDVVTDYLSAFGMEASQAAELSDMLAYAQANSNTSVDQLAAAYKNCAAYLHGMGQDVDVVTAELAMMANQGLKGSEAGTALTAIMRDLNANMKDGAIMIGDVAVAAVDAEGNFRDLTDIVADIDAATQGMSESERAAALAATFTADSTKGLNLLLNAGAGEAVNFTWGLRSASVTMEGLRDVIGQTADGGDKLTQALESVGLTTEDFAVAVEMSGGSADGLLESLREMALTGGDVDKFMAELGMTTDDLQAAMDECAGSAEVMAATMNDNLQGQLTLLSSAMDGVALSIYDGVSPALKDVVASVNDSFIPGLQAMVSGSENAGEMLRQGFAGVFESVLTMVQEFGPRVAEGAVQLVSAAAQGLVSSLPEMITAVVDIASAVVVAIAGEIPNVLMAVLEALPEIAHALMENRSTIMEAAKNVFTTLAEALPVVLPQILTAVAGVVVELVGGFLSSIPQFVEAGVQIIMGLVGGILSSIPALIGAALDAAGSMLDSVLGFFGIHSPSRKFHWIAEMDMEGMEDGFEDETPGVVRTVRRSMERVYDAADGGDLWRAMASIGGGAAGSAAQWQAQASMAAQAASASSPAGTSNTWSIGKVVVEARDAMEASSVGEFFDVVLRRSVAYGGC